MHSRKSKVVVAALATVGFLLPTIDALYWGCYHIFNKKHSSATPRSLDNYSRAMTVAASVAAVVLLFCFPQLLPISAVTYIAAPYIGRLVGALIGGLKDKREINIQLGTYFWRTRKFKDQFVNGIKNTVNHWFNTDFQTKKIHSRPSLVKFAGKEVGSYSSMLTRLGAITFLGKGGIELLKLNAAREVDDGYQTPRGSFHASVSSNRSDGKTDDFHDLDDDCASFASEIDRSSTEDRHNSPGKKTH